MRAAFTSPNFAEFPHIEHSPWYNYAQQAAEPFRPLAIKAVQALWYAALLNGNFEPEATPGPVFVPLGTGEKGTSLNPDFAGKLARGKLYPEAVTPLFRMAAATLAVTRGATAIYNSAGPRESDVRGRSRLVVPEHARQPLLHAVRRIGSKVLDGVEVPTVGVYWEGSEDGVRAPQLSIMPGSEPAREKALHIDVSHKPDEGIAVDARDDTYHPGELPRRFNPTTLHLLGDALLLAGTSPGSAAQPAS